MAGEQHASASIRNNRVREANLRPRVKSSTLSLYSLLSRLGAPNNSNHKYISQSNESNGHPEHVPKQIQNPIPARSEGDADDERNVTRAKSGEEQGKVTKGPDLGEGTMAGSRRVKAGCPRAGKAATQHRHNYGT